MPRLLSLTLLLLAATPAHAESVTLVVSGLTASTGQIGCAIHGPDGAFPGDDDALERTAIPASGSPEVTCRFDDLPPGRYAGAAIEDLNGNGELDTNLLGIPTEAWGVTRNARPSMRAPRFEEAAFDLPAGGAMRLTIRVE